MTTTLSPPNHTASDHTASKHIGSDHSSTTKMIRYVVVTLVASPGTLLVYALLLANTAWPAAAANLAAAMIIAGPTYILNRRWVWGRRQPHSMATEVAPYWAATALNVGLSSAAAATLDRLGAADSVLVAATFAVYTALWLARFLFLDVLFRPDPRSS